MDDFLQPTDIAWQGDVGVVQYGKDNNVVIFYNRAVHSPQKSKDTGRPYSEDKVFVRIHPPGERNNIIDRPARGEDARRWPIQWAAFKQNNEQTAPGTQIELLYPMSPAIAQTLRANGVQTVEQCAELSGTAIDQLGMGAQSWANDAKKYLDDAQKGVHQTQFRYEMEQKDGEIRVLTQQVELLKAQVNQLMAAQGVQAPTNMVQLQQLLAGLMQNPQVPPAGGPVAKVFDSQGAQINAAGAEIAATAARKRGRPRKQP